MEQMNVKKMNVIQAALLKRENDKVCSKLKNARSGSHLRYSALYLRNSAHGSFDHINGEKNDC